MSSFTIIPDGPFSLAAAAAFGSGFGPNTGRPKPGPNEMRLAFVTDDMRHHAAVHLTERSDGAIAAAVESDADQDAVRAQVMRILSLDHPGGPWAAIGERDPVLGALQRANDWLRPVLFHSPYEAAAWSVISARRYRAQATAVRARICAEFGAMPRVAGEEVPAFPLPERLLTAESLPGMAANRVAWLRAIARAALDGQLDASRVAAMAPDDALTDLRTLPPGIGPMCATLILLRAAGVTDVLTGTEPRLAEYVAHFYGPRHAPAPTANTAPAPSTVPATDTVAAATLASAADTVSAKNTELAANAVAAENAVSAADTVPAANPAPAHPAPTHDTVPAGDTVAAGDTVPASASAREIEHIAEGWRPYRTWAAVLIRAAGEARPRGLPLSA
jgi:DNA-3-methyladenine glycosylase II